MDPSNFTATIASIVQAQLQSALAALQQNQLLPPVAVPQPPPFSPPPLPASFNDLSRQNSVDSSSSLTRSYSSASSVSVPDPELQINESNYGDSGDDGEPAKKKRKRTPSQLSKDKNRIRRAVLRTLDAKYLAPLNSPLFRRQFKVQPNPDGTHSLKKNPDIVVKLLKRVIKPVLRQIIGNVEMGQQQVLLRFYNAALQIVKKRRANHVQQWRQKARSMRLIYDRTGRFIYGNRVLNPATDDNDEQESQCSSPPPSPTAAPAQQRKRKRKRKRKRVLDFWTDSDFQSDGDEVPTTPPPADEVPTNPPPADEVPTNPPPADEVRTNPPPADEVPTIPPPVDKPKPPCDFVQVASKCTDCGKAFNYNSALPFSLSKKKQCPVCFDKHVKTKYVGLIHECRESGREQREEALADRDDKGKRKRRVRTSCKHCGSTTHVTIRSKKCPYNKNNPASMGEEHHAAQIAATRKAVKDQRRRKSSSTADDAIVIDGATVDDAVNDNTTGAVGETEDEKTVAVGETEDEVDETPTRKRRVLTSCKHCGSTTHVTIRSKKCPYNKNNPALISAPIVTVDDAVDDDTTETEDEKTVAVGETEDEVDETEDEVDETPTFRMGSNVLAKWGRSWYLSHVCGVEGQGKFAVYDVYCPVAKRVQCNLSSDKVRVFDSPNVPCRTDLVRTNATFFYEGDKDISPSTWKVRSVQNEKNEFVCVRISPADATGPNIDNFAVGFVFQQVRDESEERRECGPRR